MSINITLLNGETPQIHIELSGEQNVKDRERFTKLAQIVHTGLTNLGHSDFFEQHKAIHVNLIRTHWSGDKNDQGGNYSAVGCGDPALKEKLKNDYVIEDYNHIYDANGECLTRAILRGRDGKKETLDIAMSDRHPPLIDGIYTTLLLAQQFFPGYSINFAVAANAKDLLNISEAVDPSLIEDPTTAQGAEPTYTYLNKLVKAIGNLNAQPIKKSMQIFHQVHLPNKSSIAKDEVEAEVYDGKELLKGITESYIDDKQRKRIWEVFKDTTKIDFMTYYAPIDEIIAECDRLVELESGVKPKDEPRAAPQIPVAPSPTPGPSPSLSQPTSKPPSPEPKILGPAAPPPPETPKTTEPVSNNATTELLSPTTDQKTTVSEPKGGGTTSSTSTTTTNTSPQTQKATPPKEKKGFIGLVNSFFKAIFSPFTRLWNFLFRKK